jgi:hypothetical protein
LGIRVGIESRRNSNDSAPTATKPFQSAKVGIVSAAGCRRVRRSLPMRALFECRLEHIGRYDRVKVECACGCEVLLPLDAFSSLPSNARIIDLTRRLRCDSCDYTYSVY